MTTVSRAAIDLDAMKRRQQATWASGDFSVIAKKIVPVAERLVEACDVQAGWRVLDVATGSGNAAIAAARHDCRVTGVDYVPALLERARLRAAMEHAVAEFVEGDAERLPFHDGSFDAVLSVFGAMFAPDHRRTASELARVCRSGGRIALACWTPTGYLGEVFRVLTRRVPPPAGVRSPMLWGDEAHLREIFGPVIGAMRCSAQICVFRALSALDHVRFFRRYYGPTLRAFEAIDPAGRSDLEAELATAAGKFDRNSGAGPAAIVGEYLETVIVRA